MPYPFEDIIKKQVHTGKLYRMKAYSQIITLGFLNLPRCDSTGIGGLQLLPQPERWHTSFCHSCKWHYGSMFGLQKTNGCCLGSNQTPLKSEACELTTKPYLKDHAINVTNYYLSPIWKRLMICMPLLTQNDYHLFYN